MFIQSRNSSTSVLGELPLLCIFLQKNDRVLANKGVRSHRDSSLLQVKGPYALRNMDVLTETRPRGELSWRVHFFLYHSWAEYILRTGQREAMSVRGHNEMEQQEKMDSWQRVLSSTS